MSRVYDTVEPSVVDEEMLQKAVEEQGPKEEAGRIAKSEGVDFRDVTCLRLDFRNILKIDNLWGFTTLTKLQLDNNIIEKIEGLDTLTSLIWLDLSFNNIEVIEGLDKLTKLEDLTLYNNRITRLENMDSLTKLDVFSVGNNQLKELDNILYLRRFKQLRTLNVNGNPICEEENYKPYVVAHLPNLEYLDYRLIDQAAKTNAREKYEISIQEIEHDERQALRKAEEKRSQEEEIELHKAAYVENLDGSALFDALYAEDTEGQKLNTIPGIEELLLSFKEKFSAICHEMFEFGLARHEERMAEVKMFWECVEEAKKENKDLGMTQIDTFMEYKKKLWDEVNEISDTKVLEMKIADFNGRVSELWDALMGLELQLVDQLEESIKEFERNMADMVSGFIEHVQGLISQCRELENTHNEKLQESAIITLEKVVKNELEEELSDDLRELFIDKDTVINAVTSSHDVHLLKLDNREDEMITRINTWMTSLIEEIHDREEIDRNRARVSEINNLVDHLRDEMDNLDLVGPNY